MANDLDHAHRALLVHTGGGLGDLLTTSPIADALKARVPGLRVTVWALASHAPVLERHPAIDELWTAPSSAPFAALLREMRRRAFDLAVFTWARDRQVWLSRLAGIPIRVGPARRLAYGFLFTHRVKVRTEFGDRHSHWVDVQLDYARALGWSGALLPPRICLADEERRRARAWLGARGIGPDDVLCALHIGKGLRIDRVGWPLDRFIELGRGLAARHGAICLVTGAAHERPLADRVAAAIGGRAMSVAGETPDLRLFCGVLDACALFTGIDSGPMHVAAALGVPVVAAFPLASDIPARWHPFGVPHQVFGVSDWTCARTCVKERCPDFECLAHLDVTAALDGAAALLPLGLARRRSAVSA